DVRAAPAMARLRGYLIAGVLVWLPILATVWVLGFIIDLTDRVLLLLPEAWRPEQLLGFRVPGLGIVIALIVLALTGLAVTNLIGRRLVAYWDDLVKRIPLVRSIHGGVKSFTESVLNQSGTSFKQVVMIEYPRAGIWSIGFVTAENIREISEKSGEPQVCVYVPTTPNPTSGLIVMVPRSQVKILDMSVDAAMKMIVTLGVVAPN
ncbi:MAG: DUF502 domain-containing protein, partial [Steroidobacteraceae bacterium]|nr:DUF502 domain-containing protein [Steroidobacteraceae bacterium]